MTSTLVKCPKCATWQHSLYSTCPKCGSGFGLATAEILEQAVLETRSKDLSGLSTTTRRRAEVLMRIVEGLDPNRTYTRAEIVSMMVAEGDATIAGQTVTYLINRTGCMTRVGRGLYRRVV